jgi:hypothetical protein
MLQKHGVIGGTLMLIRVARLLSQKLFKRSGKQVGEQLVSLGDGGFSIVEGPEFTTAAGFSGSTGSGIQGADAVPLLQIASRSKSTPAPAGHYGTPGRPNG